MKRQLIGIVIAMGITGLIGLSAMTPDGLPDNPEENPWLRIDSSMSTFVVGDAITHDNLQVFPIYGEAALPTGSYVTLNNALEDSMVTMHETSEVNELTVDNHSQHYIFIHSGDIVKGGRQDRTIRRDVILPPMAMAVNLQSFCVEQGRWAQRDGEAVMNFASNDRMIVSKEMKQAVAADGVQSNVWSEVANVQHDLNSNASMFYGYDHRVNNTTSPSSLQLALEDSAVIELTAGYEAVFDDLLTKHPEALGYAYAIDGELMGIEVYNERQLFVDLWPKLSAAFMTEAASDVRTDSIDVWQAATANDVLSLIGSINLDSTQTEEVNDITSLLIDRQPAGDLVLFATLDGHLNDQWVHRSFLPIDTSMAARQPTFDSFFFESGGEEIQQQRLNIEPIYEDYPTPIELNAPIPDNEDDQR